MLQLIVRAVDLAHDEVAHGAVGTGHDDDEFVAADAADHIDRTEAVPEHIRDAL